MSNIRLDTIGEILEGDDKGKFIKILDDSQSTGGYLIVTSQGPKFETGYDDWVEDWDSLEGYFQESNWIIRWLA